MRRAVRKISLAAPVNPNLFPNPFAVNSSLPNSVSKNVMLVLTFAARALGERRVQQDIDIDRIAVLVLCQRKQIGRPGYVGGEGAAHPLAAGRIPKQIERRPRLRAERVPLLNIAPDFLIGPECDALPVCIRLFAPIVGSTVVPRPRLPHKNTARKAFTS